MAIVVAIATAGACSSGTGPGDKPTSARITVTGTTPAPLQLVISTDFFEVLDDATGERRQVVQRADTSFIGLPHERTVPLTDLGSILVTLTNFETEPAQVRMRMELDNGRDPFDQSATMSQGGTLRFVFVFLTTRL